MNYRQEYFKLQDQIDSLTEECKAIVNLPLFADYFQQLVKRLTISWTNSLGTTLTDAIKAYMREKIK